MRKYRYLAVAAAGVMVLTAPVGTALAAIAHPAANKPVLLVGSSKGKAVKNGAKIGASLAAKHSATFVIGKTTKYTGTCSKSTLTAKVVKNPAAKGRATLAVTGVNVGGKCTISPVIVAGMSLTSLIALNLPANATIAVGKHDSVTVSPAKGKKLGWKATLDVPGYDSDLVCVYTANKITGSESNKGNTVSFSNQAFSLDAAASSNDTYCGIAGSVAYFSATYGPVRDSSVKHHPKVYVG
jgi:hypothetical protein